MKFVLFNIAVVAALIFLFNADRADLRTVADRAYAAVRQAKDVAEEVTKKAEKPAAEIAESAPAAPAQTIPAPDVEPAKPAPAVKKADKRTAEPPTPIAQKVTAAPIKELDPAVARRRAEVLGIAARAKPSELAEVSEQLMTPEQRRRELFTLAEEMELFYVRRLSR